MRTCTTQRAWEFGASTIALNARIGMAKQQQALPGVQLSWIISLLKVREAEEAVGPAMIGNPVQATMPWAWPTVSAISHDQATRAMEGTKWC